MKILFLLENTQYSDEFGYTKALVEVLAHDGYEPSICFTTSGTNGDWNYQLVKDYVVHHLTKLHFQSGDEGYAGRLARHIDKFKYDAVVVSQSSFGGVDMVEVFRQLETRPRLVFVGHKCNDTTARSAKALSVLDHLWVATSQNVATRFMAEYETAVIYGPAVKPESTGCKIREQFNVRPEARIIGYIGNVDEVNVDLMLEVCKRLSAGLLIAGTGKSIARVAERTGPIKVFPNMPQCRQEWFEAMDCFLYPVGGAGFPMLPLEAALCGCPVAMTPVGDMYQLLKGKFQFAGLKSDDLVKAVQGAVRTDVESVGRYVEETFSVEKLLSGWQVLLS